MSSMFCEVSLEQLMKLKNDKSKQLKSSEYKSSGYLAIVDQGKELICGYTNDLNKKFDKGLPVTIFGDHTLHVKFVDFDFAIGADGTQVIGCKDSINDEKYLYYLITHASNLIPSHGYSRHFKILKEFNVPYTSVPDEQKKIASILTSVDTVIEKTEAQINKLKDLKKAMMQELLTKGIGHTEFKDSPVGRIPVGWEVLSLEDACEKVIDCKNRTPIYQETGFPVVRTPNVRDGILVTKGIKFTDYDSYLEWTKRGTPSENDVLITREAPLGETCLVPPNYPLCLGQRMMLFRVDHSKAVPQFFLYMFMSQGVQYSLELLSGGSTVGHVRVGDLKELGMAFPPIQEQQKITSLISSADTNIQYKQRKLSHTKSLKKALMQDLVTGKVRVKV